MRLELRLDIFNITNRVNLNGGVNDLSNSSFGTSTGLNNNPRNMQVAGRINF